MKTRLMPCLALALLTGCSSLGRRFGETDSVRAAAKAVSFERLGNRIDVLLDGKPYTAFHFDSKWPKPFLYPIRTASGTALSRGYPVEPRAGEEQDHPWHRGIWYGHGDINGQDFWREKPDGTTSRLVLAGKPETSEGTLEARLSMITSKGPRIGTIGERYKFSQDGQNVLIDSTITVEADEGEPLRFGDTEDGGFAFRLSDDFRQDRGAELLNSDGLIGTENIWGKPARWVKYSAAVQSGKRAGVAVIDHPSNLRHPTRWHARGYSFCTANPFGLAEFTKDKKADGSYTLPAGQTLRLRYLVIIHDGDLSKDAVDRYFTRFGKGS